MSHSERNRFGLVVILVLLSACNPLGGVPVALVQRTSTPARAPTSAPTSTPAPSATPALTPTATPTQRPARIEPGNVAQVRQLASWQSTSDSWIKQITWSSDGKTLAALERHRAVVWDAASGRALQIIDGPNYSASLSPDGRLLAGQPDDYTVRLWDTRTGREVRNLGQHSSPAFALPFSLDGRLIFVGSVYSVQKIWEVETGRMVGDLDYSVTGVVSAAFSPDGKVLAVGTGSSRGGGIELWDVATVDELTSFFDGRDDKIAVAFSPDGKLLVSGSLFGNVKLWDVASGREASKLESPRSSINAIAFSPGGELLAVATGEGVRLLQVPGLHELRLMTGHTGDVDSAAFSPDGRLLATGSEDGTLKIWGLEP